MQLADTFAYHRDVLVFLRVPKTASTSLTSVLTEAIGPENTFHLPDRHLDALDHGLHRAHDQLRRFSVRASSYANNRLKKVLGEPDPMEEALFLHGHHPLWAALRSRRRPHYFIVLRDPVDRLISLYYFYRAKAVKAQGAMCNEKRLTFTCDPDDFVRRLFELPIAKRLNSHCCFLSRNGRFAEAREALNEHVRFAATLDNLQHLKSTLSEFMQTEFREIRRENVSSLRPRDNPLSPKVERQLRGHLADDYRLFDYVAANNARFLYSESDRSGTSRNPEVHIQRART